jgi:hypothetical protein
MVRCYFKNQYQAGITAQFHNNERKVILTPEHKLLGILENKKKYRFKKL